jgi:hypothetical protein
MREQMCCTGQKTRIDYYAVRASQGQKVYYNYKSRGCRLPHLYGRSPRLINNEHQTGENYLHDQKCKMRSTRDALSFNRNRDC